MKSNNFLILIKILLVFTSSGFTLAKVTTNVESKGKADYFFEERQHTKFNLFKFVFCWGGESNHDEKTLTGSHKNTNNFGSNSLSANKFEDKSFGNSHHLGDFNWKTDFDEKNYSFDIQFKKKVGEINKTINNSDKCNTRTTSYKIREFTNEVTTNLELYVPNNIWVIRFKATGFKDKMANFQLYGVSEISNDAHIGKTRFIIENMKDSNEKKIPGVPGYDGYSYYFIRPGTKIKLIVKYIDDTLIDRDFIGNIEVTYLGENRCEDFKNHKITSDYIKDSFSQVYKKIGDKSKIDEKQLHNLIRKIACVSKSKTLIKAINFNKSSDILKILNTVSDFQEDLMNKTISNNIIHAKDSHRVKNAMRIFSNMFNYKLASSTLKILAPLCKMVNFDGKSIYDLLYDNFFKMKTSLNIAGNSNDNPLKKKTLVLKPSNDIASASLRMIRLLDTFEKKADRQKIQFHKILNYVDNDFYNKEKDAILSQTNEAFQHLYGIKLDHISKMPQIKDHLQIERFYTDFKKYFYNLKKTKKIIRTLFKKIDSHENSPLNLTKVRTYLKKYSTSEIKVLEVNFMKSTYELEKYLSQEFSLDITDVREEHYQHNADWLSSSYGGFLSDFVKHVDNSDIGVDQTKLNYTVQGCL